MRFIWKLIQRDTGGPPDHEKLAMQAIAESKEAAQEVDQNREHLKIYLEQTGKIPTQGKKQFDDQLAEWYKRGDKVSMRMGGVSEVENDKDYLKRHARLSSAFVTWDKKSQRIAGSIDFKGNETAEYKVGLGDVLPPIVKVVKVQKKNGDIVDCVRTQNPRTGRIGYYETGSLSKGEYAYVAIHSGDSFEVTRTIDPNDPKAQRDILREHVLVYRSNAMEADEGEELYYNNKGQPLTGTPGARREQGKARVQSGGAKQRAGFQKALGTLGVRQAPKERVPKTKHAPRHKPTPRKTPEVTTGHSSVEIQGKKYQKLTQDFLKRFIASTPEQMGQWLVPTTFLGTKVNVNVVMLPYLKEAEARIREAGIDYKIDPHGGGCGCYNWRRVNLMGKPGESLSKHSWAIALDVNPAYNEQGKRWDDLNPTKRVPSEMVKIMEDCGFYWGNNFKIPDAMHFQLQINPFTSQDLLRSSEAKAAMARAEKIAGYVGPQTREAWAKAKQGTPESNSRVAKNEKEVGSSVPKQSPSSRPPSKVSAESIERAVSKYNNIIYEAAERYNVPANLIKTVMWQESGGRPLLASHAGAGGLMQFMPATARAYGLEPVLPMRVVTDGRGRKHYEIDPRDGRANPREIIMAGAKLLSWLLKKYNGDVRTALSAYNWGPGNVEKYLKGQKKMPEETAFYYKNITAQKDKLDTNDPRHA